MVVHSCPTLARGVESRNADAILPIPLFVKYPGQTQARVDDRFAEARTVEATHADRRVLIAIAVDGIVRAFTRTVLRAHGKPQPFHDQRPSDGSGFESRTNI